MKHHIRNVGESATAMIREKLVSIKNMLKKEKN